MSTTELLTEDTSLPLLPLRDVVVFPHMVIPLFVGRPKSIKALEKAMESDKQILLLAQKSASKDEPSADDLYALGTVATVPSAYRSSAEGSSLEADFCASSRICLSDSMAFSSALMDLGRPTNRGMTICGNTTTSRNGRSGRLVSSVSNSVVDMVSTCKNSGAMQG